MRFPFEVQPAEFVMRPNRFLIVARLANGGTIRAHCPDPGRLGELLVPGAILFVSSAPPGGSRSTTHTARLVKAPGGQLVSLDSTLANRLFQEALEAGALAPFLDAEGVRAEVPLPTAAPGRVHSRIDFAISMAEGRTCWVEVKSATLVEGGVARFPDAVTARGCRHVEELTALVRTGGRAMVCFVVQRPDAVALEANIERDPAFARALAEGVSAGLECHAWVADLSLTSATIVREIPVRL